MTNEQTNQPKQPDIPITREQFLDAKSSNYLKFEADKDYVIGVQSMSYVMREYKSGEGLKPTMVLLIDYLDGIEIEEPQEFSSSSKRLAETVEEYKSNEECNLFKWFFKFRKTGKDVSTAYTLTPKAPRPSQGGPQSRLDAAPLPSNTPKL